MAINRLRAWLTFPTSGSSISRIPAAQLPAVTKLIHKSRELIPPERVQAPMLCRIGVLSLSIRRPALRLANATAVCGPVEMGRGAKLASEMAGFVKQGVFVSHIGAEATVALVLQEYLRRAYPSEFPVFVSSDKRSLPGGEGWWQQIRDSIKERQLVLVLLSDEFARREWINFEAGVGDGAGAKVVSDRHKELSVR